METVIDFLVAWQGEILTGAAVVGAKYIPAGWNSVLRQSARFAEWYSELVSALLGEKSDE